MEVSSGHYKFPVDIFSLCRLARTTAPRNEVRVGAAWRGRDGGGCGAAGAAFSGNFPVAPCANIYREYRDLCKLARYVGGRDAALTFTAARFRHRLRAVGDACTYSRRALCTGEPCEYMHKNVYLRVPLKLCAPRLSHPTTPRASSPLVAPLLAPIDARRPSQPHAPRENVFGSRTCQPNVNLSGTSRNDYVHDLHRRTVQSCICSASVFNTPGHTPSCVGAGSFHARLAERTQPPSLLRARIEKGAAGEDNFPKITLTARFDRLPALTAARYWRGEAGNFVSS